MVNQHFSPQKHCSLDMEKPAVCGERCCCLPVSHCMWDVCSLQIATAAMDACTTALSALQASTSAVETDAALMEELGPAGGVVRLVWGGAQCKSTRRAVPSIPLYSHQTRPEFAWSCFFM